MLGAVAEFERSIIREHQREGIAVAKAKAVNEGKRYGSGRLSPKEIKSLKAKRAKGVSVRDLMDQFNLSRASVDRLTAPR